MLYAHVVTPTSLPKPIKSISSLTITYIENSACIKINDNRFVNMSFLYGKLVNTNVPNAFNPNLSFGPDIV